MGVDAQDMPSDGATAGTLGYGPPLKSDQQGTLGPSAVPQRRSPGRLQEFPQKITIEPPGTADAAGASLRPAERADRTYGTAEAGPPLNGRPLVTTYRLRAQPQMFGVETRTARPGRTAADPTGAALSEPDMELSSPAGAETPHQPAEQERDMKSSRVRSHQFAESTDREAPPFPPKSLVPTVRPVSPSRPAPQGELPAAIVRQPLREAEPTIQVTIGRIHVIAVSQPAAAPRERSTPQVMPLDEYLRQRSRRGDA